MKKREIKIKKSLLFILLIILPIYLLAEMIPGMIISSGSAPFTMTWDEMVRLDESVEKKKRKDNFVPLMPLEIELQAIGEETFVHHPAPTSTRTDPPTILSSFDAVDLNESGWYPPDSNGAIGPNHFMEVINGRVAIYDRNGTQLSSVTLTNFFTFSYGGTTYPRNNGFDPRIIYVVVDGSQAVLNSVTRLMKKITSC